VDFAGCYFLGSQSWTRSGVNGSWQLGLAPIFLQTIDPIRSIEFPDADSELQQGGLLVRITTEGGLVHNVWSPLSGKILLSNNRLEATPDLPHQDPVTTGWLLRILPANLEQEVRALTLADSQHRLS
jgi:glycine cleavage system H lipoate-binding protein